LVENNTVVSEKSFKEKVYMDRWMDKEQTDSDKFMYTSPHLLYPCLAFIIQGIHRTARPGLISLGEVFIHHCDWYFGELAITI